MHFKKLGVCVNMLQKICPCKRFFAFLFVTVWKSFFLPADSSRNICRFSLKFWNYFFWKLSFLFWAKRGSMKILKLMCITMFEFSWFMYPKMIFFALMIFFLMPMESRANKKLTVFFLYIRFSREKNKHNKGK